MIGGFVALKCIGTAPYLPLGAHTRHHFLVTNSAWEEGVRALRQQLPPTSTTCRVRWGVDVPLERPDSYPPVAWIALFRAADKPGAAPIVILHSAAVDDVRAMPQGATVEVFGEIAPGRALAIRTRSGEMVWPSYPAEVSRRRKYRL